MLTSSSGRPAPSPVTIGRMVAPLKAATWLRRQYTGFPMRSPLPITPHRAGVPTLRMTESAVLVIPPIRQ
jgi:hypothetical protein